MVCCFRYCIKIIGNRNSGVKRMLTIFPSSNELQVIFPVDWRIVWWFFLVGLVRMVQNSLNYAGRASVRSAIIVEAGAK